MIHSKTFEVTNGNGLVELTTAADSLTGSCTHTTTDRGKGIRFRCDSGRFFIPPLKPIDHPKLRLNAAHLGSPALAPRQLHGARQMHVYLVEFAELQHRREANSTEINIFFLGSFAQPLNQLERPVIYQSERRGGGVPARFHGGIPQIAKCGLSISGFLRMEGQLFVTAIQVLVTPDYRLDSGPMDLSTPIARYGVCTGHGDDLMPETHGVAAKRVDKCKSLELEQHI